MSKFNAIILLIVQVVHRLCQFTEVYFMNVADVCVFWGNLLKLLHIAPEGG